jgi:hypothetical protein
VRRQLHGQVERLVLRFADGFGAQVLRAAEDVEAFEVQLQPPDLAQRPRHVLGVDAELLGPPAHLHAGRLELEPGVDANRHPGRA